MTGLHHIGYWVDDLPTAIGWATETLGAGPFTIVEDVDLGAGFRFRDRPAVLRHTAAFGQWGPVMLELDIVHEVTPELGDALRIGHGNVSHVAWTTDDLGRERSRLEGAGCPLLTTSRAVAWADWFEGGPLFGHPIEIHQPTPPVLAMWRNVRGD